MDMCSGSILKKLLLFALPLMCSSILQLLFNAADIVVVGRFAGDHSLAAVGSTTSLINLLTNLFVGLSIGGNVLVARLYGAGRMEEVGKAVQTAMVLSFYSGIVLTLIGILGAKQILIWMKTPEEVLSLATLYLRVYFAGMTATMIYNFGSAILRAVGDTKRPLYYLLGAGALNVVLNLLFVIVLRMDVAGVALATVLSQCVSAVLIVRCMIKENGAVHLVLRDLHIERDKFLRILQIGLPAGFQGIIFALSNVVIQSSINYFGPTTVAGNSAAANLEGFVYFAMNAFYQAAMSFTGQNMGAGQYKRIDRIAITGELCVAVTGIVLGNLVAFSGRPLLSIYSSTPAVIEAGMLRLHVIARTYALCGMMDVMVGVLRGLGYSVLPTVTSLIGACGLRLLWIATIFQLPSLHSVTVLYTSYPVTWSITLLANVICFLVIRKKIWRQKEQEGV